MQAQDFHWKASIISILFALMIVVGGSQPVKAESVEELDLEAASSILIDSETEQVLYADGPDEVRAIASLTKMLVQYIVLEEIEAGNLDWDEEVDISPFLASLSHNFILSNVPLATDQTYTVSDLFESVSVYSANAATIALAEHIEGSEEAFVHRMRGLVEDFGIRDAHLVNTTGLHNSYMEGHHIPGSHEDDENAMSARSVAIIAHRLVQDFPEFLTISEIPILTFETGSTPFVVENWNKMLPGLSHEYLGVRGLKTGTTESAGRSFAGYFDGERPMVAIVLNSGELDDESTRGSRFDDTAELFDYGQEAWTYESIIDQEEWTSQAADMPVEAGQADSVSLYIEADFAGMVLQGDSDFYTVTENFDPDLMTDSGALQAPLEAGQEIGELTVSFDEGLNYLYGDQIESMNFPIYVGEDVDHQNVFVRLWDRFTNWVQNLV